MTTNRVDVSGHYAGAVTRLLAYAADAAIAGFLFFLGMALVDYALQSIVGVETTSDSLNPYRVAAAAGWIFVYWWGSIAIAGKTLGKALLGLRVLGREGDVLSGWRSALRAVALPISFLLFGAGFLGIVLNKERRALHDLIAGSVVVYDWGDRAAELPSPISAYINKRSDGLID